MKDRAQVDLFGETVFSPLSVSTEGIKYAGSKLKILPQIAQLSGRLSGVRSVLDGFSGSTRVAQAFSQLGYDTTACDVSVWSETLATCYLLSSEPDSFYSELLDYLNNLNGYDGWFTEHYGGSEHDVKYPFQIKNTRKLDAIRDEIDKLHLTQDQKSVVLTSLMLGLDAVDSTMGHYVSYLNSWSARSYNDLVLRLPKRKKIQTNNSVVRGDIFDQIGLSSYDLAYFDPPYGSNNELMPPSRVRYAAYYHFWKTVILNDKPLVFGKATRREDSRDTAGGSVFEEFRKDETGNFLAIKALGELIAKTNARYIMLSYSSGGRATKEGLVEIINQNGKLVQAVEIDHKQNVMSAMRWTNQWVNSDGKHSEYLFLMEKQ